MPLTRLDHVNVRTVRLAGMIAFYRDAMGLKPGPRPAFTFGGAWLYCGDRPIVHLVEVATAPEPVGDLRLEHFAFAATDFDGFCRNLEARGVNYRVGKAADFPIRQVHVADPDGNHVHIDFAESAT